MFSIINRIKIKFGPKRWEIIQYVIDKFSFTSYLEIGVSNRECFDLIKCKEKTGVDPSPKSKVIEMTSDDFFLQNTKKFDVIFIDGLHHSIQVKKDIENSLKILNDGGYIFIHDCNPFNEKMQLVPRESVIWSGDVWKAWMHFRGIENLIMYVIDADYGMGVIWKGFQERIYVSNPQYKDLIRNRKRWLNIRSFKKFKNILNHQLRK